MRVYFSLDLWIYKILFLCMNANYNYEKNREQWVKTHKPQSHTRYNLGNPFGIKPS